LKKLFLITFIILAISSCSYDEPKKTSDEEVTKIFAVQMQVVGSLIEGMSVCYDKNNTCKQTDKNGMVEFDTFGKYSFKIRDINLSTLKIDANRTIISPYTLFDKNETLAGRSVLLLHAFDKGEKIDDEEVLLSLSTYIPKIKDFPTLLAKSKIEIIPKDINTILNMGNSDSNSSDENDTSRFVNEYELLRYTTNDSNLSNVKEHNITINFTENNITRDNKQFHVDIPNKESYERLDSVMKFVDLAVDKNVTFNNFEEKYLLTKNSLTSFNLGEKYVVSAIVKKDHVVLQFFDNSSRITDETILILNEEENVLSTNLLDIYCKIEE
jgi:hypothetical protein